MTAILASVGAMAGYYLLFTNAVKGDEAVYVYLHEGSTAEDLKDQLYPLIKKKAGFDLLAARKGIWKKLIPGKYKLETGMSNYKLVRMFSSGNSEQVTLKLKAEMSRDSLVNYCGQELGFDPQLLDSLLLDTANFSSEFDLESVYCMFLPDHYFFKWASSPKTVIERFEREYNKFWTNERDTLAAKQGLSRIEVCVLASIVDGEAIHISEMPRIAGLYLNRLRKGIPLQADPTILFLVNEQGRRRVLNTDLERIHPYNTYLNKGLPPGPIMLPDKRAIEAVLKAENHDYIYMCAKEDGSFYHYFTDSYNQHLRNRAKYIRSLEQRNIDR